MKQIIKCGRVFTATDESVRENMAVAVEDGKITAVVPMQEADSDGSGGHRPFRQVRHARPH